MTFFSVLPTQVDLFARLSHVKRTCQDLDGFFLRLLGVELKEQLCFLLTQETGVRTKIRARADYAIAFCYCEKLGME